MSQTNHMNTRSGIAVSRRRTVAWGGFVIGVPFDECLIMELPSPSPEGAQPLQALARAARTTQARSFRLAAFDSDASAAAASSMRWARSGCALKWLHSLVRQPVGARHFTRRYLPWRHEHRNTATATPTTIVRKLDRRRPTRSTNHCGYPPFQCPVYRISLRWYQLSSRFAEKDPIVSSLGDEVSQRAAHGAGQSTSAGQAQVRLALFDQRHSVQRETCALRDLRLCHPCPQPGLTQVLAKDRRCRWFGPAGRRCLPWCGGHRELIMFCR